MGMWNPNLALFSLSKVAIPSETGMLEMYHVMTLQDFISCGEFHIENESKVDEINIVVGNRTEWSLVVYESRCVKSKKLGFDTSLV